MSSYIATLAAVSTPRDVNHANASEFSMMQWSRRIVAPSKFRMLSARNKLYISLSTRKQRVDASAYTLSAARFEYISATFLSLDTILGREK